MRKNSPYFSDIYDAASRWISSHKGRYNVTTTHGYVLDSMPVSEGLIVKNRTYNLSRGYDAGDRLTSWNRTGNVAVGSRQTEAWAYDNAGNQTSVTRDGTADARTYNDGNELVSTTEGNTKRDAKGNITKDAEGNKYFYDLDNRIFRIKMKNGAKIRFAYDALSRRVFRKKGSDKKAFLWWGDQETSEHVSGAGQPVILNDLWAHPTGLNKIVARAVEGKKTDIQYYHKNYLDHVYAVSDKDGDIKEHYRYTAFGEAEIYNTLGQKLAESAIDNDVLWNSRRFDELGMLTVSQIPGSMKVDLCKSGGISWQLSLDKDHSEPGYIISKISFEWNVFDCDGKPIEKPSNTKDFFEVWGPFQNKGDSTGDTWKMPIEEECSQGSITITGDARFYSEKRTGPIKTVVENELDPELNNEVILKPWVIPFGDPNLPLSGGAPSSYTEPLYWGQPASGGEATHKFKAILSWTCCPNKTKVTTITDESL